MLAYENNKDNKNISEGLGLEEGSIVEGSIVEGSIVEGSIVDSHCHLDRLDLTGFDNGLDGVFAKAQEALVAHMLCVCIDLEHFEDVLNIAKKYPFVSASVGKHPTDKQGLDPSADKLIELVNKHREHVVAIGETGLDYFHGSEQDKVIQKARFVNHIEASMATNKPLIIHTRDAKEDTIDILKSYSNNKKPPFGVFHCFTGDYEMAKQGIDLGFYISFAGIITFKNAVELQQVAKKLPLESLLIETDSPYLAPVPYRGKPNYPAYVKEVALKLANLKDLGYNEVARVTTQNFCKCFGL